LFIIIAFDDCESWLRYLEPCLRHQCLQMLPVLLVHLLLVLVRHQLGHQPELEHSLLLAC
jgi:hypothetical protein